MAPPDPPTVLYLAPEAIIHLAWRRVGLIPEVFIAPEIPGHKEVNVREVYDMDPEEQLLVLLDDTAWGGGKDGAVLTSRRLCWREMFGEARTAPWRELKPGDVEEVEGYVRISGETISMVLVDEHHRPRLAAFLKEVIGGEIGRPHPYRGEPMARGYRDGPMRREEEISQSIIDLAQEHLGAPHSTHTWPSIPDRKLKGARQAHARYLPPDERVLALYDDTLFGGGEDGFVLTTSRLCWKNLMEAPRQVPWRYLPPETILVLDESTISLGDCKLDVMADQDRAQRTATFLRKVRALFP